MSTFKWPLAYVACTFKLVVGAAIQLPIGWQEVDGCGPPADDAQQLVSDVWPTPDQQGRLYAR